MKAVLGILVMAIAISAQAQVPGDGTFEKVFSDLDIRYRMAGIPLVICSCDINTMAASRKDVIGRSRQKVFDRCEDFKTSQGATQTELNNCQEL